MIKPPEVNEYGEYYEKYVSEVRDSDLAEVLLSQIEELRFILVQMTEETAIQPYAPNKWTYKELLGHINDTEKIMFFRALCVARNEQQPLPGFDQDDYVNAADFNSVPLSDLMEDFAHTRNSMAYFLKNLSEQASMRRSMVNGRLTSARALFYIIPGHFKHHLEVLKSVAQAHPRK